MTLPTLGYNTQMLLVLCQTDLLPGYNHVVSACCQGTTAWYAHRHLTKFLSLLALKLSDLINWSRSSGLQNLMVMSTVNEGTKQGGS